ncbi:MAG: GspH/FimT family pseudopilin [Gammaproteobacteria bacterium]
MQRASGYTALELLVTLAVGALLLTLAVPSFIDLVLDTRLTTTVNRVVHGMHVARHEALKTGADVVLCRSRTGRQCDHAAPWNAGLIVFLNRDRDDPPRVDPGEPVLQVEGRLPVASILANRRAFIFRPSGLRSVNGTLTFCDRRGAGRARAVVVSYTGRPRATSARLADGASSCPA